MRRRRKRAPESEVIYIKPSPPPATHLVTTALPCDYTMVIQRALVEVSEEDDSWNGAVFPPGEEPAFDANGNISFDVGRNCRALTWYASPQSRWSTFIKQSRLRGDVEEFLQTVVKQDIEKKARAANVAIKNKLLAEQSRQTTITKGAC